MVGHGRGRILTVGAAMLALSCVGAAAEEPATPPLNEDPPPKQLDLRPPDVTALYSREQIERLLTDFDENLEEVEVRGAAVPAPTFTPKVWGGIAAPFWALLNPLQAWRIVAPLPPDQTRGMNRKPDATSGYLEPAAKPQ